MLPIYRAGAILLTALAALAGGTSCSRPGNEWSGYHDFATEASDTMLCQWHYGQPVTFRPMHPDSLCAGHWAVAIRYTVAMPYERIALEVRYTDAKLLSGQRECRDTLWYTLADAQGHWSGTGKGWYQLCDTLAGEPVLHASGSPVELRHVMRSPTLKGIAQVGLFFIPQKPRTSDALSLENQQ